MDDRHPLRRRRRGLLSEPDASGGPLRTGPRIGYWGRFNVARFRDLLLPWIFEREIRERLPEASVHVYAPLGPRHAAPLDAGFAAADLGRWSPHRSTELADSLDCVVVAGDVIQTRDDALSADYGAASDEALRSHPSRFFVEGLGARLESRCPVAWDAVGVPLSLDAAGARRVRQATASRPYLSVRDEASRDRLARAGVEGDVRVVPDPLRRLARVFPSELLARRLEFAKHMEWFPPEGEPLVVQGSRALLKSAEGLADSVADAVAALGAPVVILELDPEDGEFAAALARVLPGPVFRIPREAAMLDRVAALAHARAFLGSSRAGGEAAAAFGSPGLVVDPSRAVPDSAAVRRLLATARQPARPSAAPQMRLEAHFDALARVAEGAHARRLRESGDAVPRLLRLLRESERRLEAWRTAHETRSRQVVDGRLQAAALLEERKAGEAARVDELLRARSERDAAEQDRLSSELTAEKRAREADRERSSAELATEKRARESVEAAAEKTRHAEESVRAELARATEQIAKWQADHERVASALRQAREKAQSLAKDLAAAKDEATHAREDGERRSERGEKMIVELRAELDRAEARLEQYRSEEAELRLSQTLLFTELAEARSDAARFAGRFDDADAREEA
ncbi:MAG TPA: polysaccharide pyruvyl transferase family protein [Thermoanaerobaculia bacterium]